MFSPESYSIIASWFPRLLGLIYFFAFGAFLFQIKGLLGENGILPIQSFLQSIKSRYPKKRYLLIPSLFWLNASDKALILLTFAGTALSILLFCGVMPWLLLIGLYILYLSIISAGQDFLAFGWEGFLLEVTAYAFLLSLTPIPNLLVWININFLLFRFHFESGIVKFLSRDKTWKNFTAVAYHYNTQPIPVMWAWYLHKLPLNFQKFSCVLMFFIELLIPFGIFGSDEVRFAVFCAFFFLQLSIWVSGNYSFLNYLTAFFSTLLISDKFLLTVLDKPYVEMTPSLLEDILLSCVAGFFLILQNIRFWQHFFPSHWAHKLLSPFSYVHLVNRYGIFAVMTTRRYEIVIEGSDDLKTWKEYGFWYKPSEVNRRPRRIAPYQPRIDWQIWFLPFSDFNSENWFQNFLIHLLKSNREVLKLIRHNPFPDQPPKYIKAIIYDYEFSSLTEKKETGHWWRRQYIGEYSPTLMLKNK